MSDYAGLIERLEKASGPDREVDAAIMYAEIERGAGMTVARIPELTETASYYTSSIDAALTLVPEGWPIDQLSWWPRVPQNYEDQRVCRVKIIALRPDGFADKECFHAVAKSPAIALCIAALKARAALSTKHGGEK
jgi:hypothetical protein